MNSLNPNPFVNNQAVKKFQKVTKKIMFRNRAKNWSTKKKVVDPNEIE